MPVTHGVTSSSLVRTAHHSHKFSRTCGFFVFYFLPEIDIAAFCPIALHSKKEGYTQILGIPSCLFQCVSLFAAATVVSSGNAIVIIVLARNCRNRDGAKYYCTKEKLEILVHNLNDFINKTYMWVINLSVSPRSESG